VLVRRVTRSRCNSGVCVFSVLSVILCNVHLQERDFSEERRDVATIIELC
jgi:hypothetical protein